MAYKCCKYSILSPLILYSRWHININLVTINLVFVCLFVCLCRWHINIFILVTINLVFVCFRWHGIKDHTLQLVMHVSPGAADLLTSLREHLSFVSENVSVLLSPALLEQLAQGMDSLLLNNVSMGVVI